MAWQNCLLDVGKPQAYRLVHVHRIYFSFDEHRDRVINGIVDVILLFIRWLLGK
jgi:hypothetical protein